MAAEETTQYNPRMFIKNKDVPRRKLAGDAAPADPRLNFRALAGDTKGARLLAGDAAE